MNAMRGLKEKVAIVTGAGGGIGSATARRLAEESARVALLDIDGAAAARVADEIVASGGSAQAFACDITDYRGVNDAAAAIEAALGPIDVLINNAGWDVFRPFLQTQPADWQRLIAIHFLGALN